MSGPSVVVPRRQWPDEDPPPPPHPAPEVACRPAMPSELSRNAVALLILANANGWRARVTYARGTSWTMRGPGKIVDSIAVRLTRKAPQNTQRLVGTWTDGKYSGGGTSSLRSLSLNELRAMLQAPIE